MERLRIARAKPILGGTFQTQSWCAASRPTKSWTSRFLDLPIKTYTATSISIPASYVRSSQVTCPNWGYDFRAPPTPNSDLVILPHHLTRASHLVPGPSRRASARLGDCHVEDGPPRQGQAGAQLGGCAAGCRCRKKEAGRGGQEAGRCSGGGAEAKRSSGSRTFPLPEVVNSSCSLRPANREL